MFRKILSICLVALTLGLTSCSSYFEGVNENPNSPTDVSMDVILPAIQVEIAEIYGGDLSRFASILTQQTEGVARQWSSTNNYSGFVPSAFNTTWENTYANILNETKILKTKAVAGSFGHYEGVSDILTAFHLMNATDVWGAIPYSNALQGTDNIGDNFATFDTQEAIYNTIFALLDNAIAKLNGSDGGLALTASDLYYGGDASLWVKAAHAIKARGFLHLGKVNSANYASALASANAAFGSADDDMTLQYGTGGTEAAQWFRFNRDRTGDVEFHPTTAASMTAQTDTFRMNVLMPIFNPDHPFLVPNYNQPLITFRELKFLEAEALMMSGGSDAAIHAAWTAGVNAAFDFFGTGGAADYFTNNDPGVGNVTMAHIMDQKRIALYATMEPYNDWRRTGIPALTPNNGLAIPTRFPYGVDEITFNPNTPNLSITDKVWWDQ